MIRKILRMFRVAVIVGLTLGAVSMACLGAFLVCASPWLGPYYSGLQPSPWYCSIDVLRGGVAALEANEDCLYSGCQCCSHGIVDSAKGFRLASRLERLVGLNVQVYPSRACGWHLSIYMSARFPWGVACLLAAYPAVTFIRGPLRRRRRRKRGLCIACGYDLTGNVTGVCSECGVAIDPKRALTTEQ